MAAESNLKLGCKQIVELGLDGMLVQVRAFSRNGFPDSILLIPNCPPVFIEFKAPGQRPRTNQLWWSKRLLGMGVKYWLIDDLDHFNESVGNLLVDYGKRKITPALDEGGK